MGECVCVCVGGGGDSLLTETIVSPRPALSMNWKWVYVQSTTWPVTITRMVEPIAQHKTEIVTCLVQLHQRFKVDL